MDIEFIAFVAVWISISFFAAGLARSLGRNSAGWALLAFFFSLPAIALLYALGPNRLRPTAAEEMRWHALKLVDPEIADAAQLMQRRGQRAEDSLAVIFLRSGDRKYLDVAVMRALSDSQQWLVPSKSDDWVYSYGEKKFVVTKGLNAGKLYETKEDAVAAAKGLV